MISWSNPTAVQEDPSDSFLPRIIILMTLTWMVFVPLLGLSIGIGMET